MTHGRNLQSGMKLICEKTSSLGSLVSPLASSTERNSLGTRTGSEFQKNTINSFITIAICKMVPAPLRWFAERTLPICHKVRADRKAGAKLLAPILVKREAEKAAARRGGREVILHDDSIEWFQTASKGRAYNDIDLQMVLSIAAIHTTSDLLSQALLNLCAHQETVEPLRQEVIEVLEKHGWKEVALTELHLLDSFLKETQPFMHRLAVDGVELPGGIKIQKGERIAISSHRMWAETDYENPDKFDGQDHTASSHGEHACPGRFFAANEVKIAMVHLLLKYDMRVNDPSAATWLEYGINMYVDPAAKISVRRKEELDLDSLVVDA
ncbi:cytochrome P450 [Acephala macrosclerotiorum]|nr:cytochrome P450 [Acephala macrosclerotiorum]